MAVGYLRKARVFRIHFSLRNATVAMKTTFRSTTKTETRNTRNLARPAPLTPHGSALSEFVNPNCHARCSSINAADNNLKRFRLHAASASYATHSIRRTKAALLYRKTGNLRACQLILGHTKLESIVRYLGVEVDGALQLSEALEI